MIVQIITRLALGGAQQIVCELSTRLKESGEDVVIFTGLSNTESEGSINNNIILNKRALKIEYKILEDNNIMLIITNISSQKKLERKVKKEQNILY